MAPPPGTVDVAQLYNSFKEIYGDDFIVMSPVERQLYEKFKFKAGEEPGKEYVEAIRMTEEQGFTFNAAGTSKRIFNDSIALKTEKATFTGNIIEFLSRVDLEALKRAMTSRQGFKETLGMTQEAMRDSLLFHLEYTLLRGGKPVGVISAISGSGANRTLTLSTSGYADAFWSSSENMPFDIYDSTSAALNAGAVRRNTVVGGVLSKFRVISWDPDTRNVVVEADTSTDWTNVAVGDCLWRTGSYRTESLGMVAVCAATNQTVFNIDQTKYGKWRAYRDVPSTSEPLSMPKIQRAIAQIRGRSAMKAQYVARMHPLQWEVINNDLAALRRPDSSYKVVRTDAGTSEIEFHSAAGSVVLQSNVFMALDECIITDDNTWTRRGVSDVDFTNPMANGNGDPQLYVWDNTSNTVQLRAYSQQGMFCNRLNRNAYLGNLTVPA